MHLLTPIMFFLLAIMPSYCLEQVRPIIAQEVAPLIDRIATVIPLQVSVFPANFGQVFVTAVVKVKEDNNHFAKRYLDSLGPFVDHGEEDGFIVTYTCAAQAHEVNGEFNRPVMQVGKAYLIVVKRNRESGSWTPYLPGHWSIYDKSLLEKPVEELWNSVIALIESE